MLNEKQQQKMLAKLVRLERTLEPYLFRKVGETAVDWYKTDKRLHQIPPKERFVPCRPGDEWGGNGAYCWFRGSFTPGEHLNGQRLYLYPKITGYEAMLWVNGRASGIYAAKFVEQSHGNHYCNMLVKEARAGEAIDIALEYYAGYYCIECSPLEDGEKRDFRYQVGTVDVCLRDETIAGFLFDLKAVNQAVAAVGSGSFRQAQLINALVKVHQQVYYSPEDVEWKVFQEALEKARPYLREVLEHKNSQSAPYAGLVGHSHMDTAWLWVMEETVKKCARTYSNQISLMEQYPEYRFVQSSAYHSEMIRRHYPELFERIREKVAQGRYEPNGGVWVECDCNITSGEMMARQFLWGQRYTREQFGYISDCFWLPDTFGYSAAIPQIMAQSGVKYFLTTKIDWNDTNQFPFDTFYWEGLDGTKVLTHFNKTHMWPDPKGLVEFIYGKTQENRIREKTVSNRKLFSFGYGDGGGGPQFEMLEMARRTRDFEGIPRSGYTSVSGFMRELEATVQNPSVYRGELYAELHRGTLTNQHQIKRNNRLAEIALHDLEYFTVRKAVQEDTVAENKAINPLTETLLVNQFHDILPGTCIPEVHEQSLRETGGLMKKARQMTEALLAGRADANSITVHNTLSFDRGDVVYLDWREGCRIDAALPQQVVDTLEEGKKLVVAELDLPAFGSRALQWTKGVPTGKSPFKLKKNILETPFARVEFDGRGGIASFRDKTMANRELRGDGYPLNTFLLAEDVPQDWDNWDIDADLELKLAPCARMLDRRVVSEGPVELRIRSEYALTERSSLTQDMIFYAHSPMVAFETVMNWQDNHRFLKTAFDTTIHAGEARHEIQFGHVKRPTSRNNDWEKARFEVSNHKYTDLSETRYGVALLNDCKYGISAEGSRLRLSLHKGGNRPDYQGDLGVHSCTYGFLPHVGGFSATTVVQPAYAFNYRALVSQGWNRMEPLLLTGVETVLAETVKPCEEEDRAFVARLYECEGSYTSTRVRIPSAKTITPVNLLEEPVGAKQEGTEIELAFRPFEIKTLLVQY